MDNLNQNVSFSQRLELMVEEYMKRFSFKEETKENCEKFSKDKKKQTKSKSYRKRKKLQKSPHRRLPR